MTLPNWPYLVAVPMVVFLTAGLLYWWKFERGERGQLYSRAAHNAGVAPAGFRITLGVLLLIHVWFIVAWSLVIWLTWPVGYWIFSDSWLGRYFKVVLQY